LSREQEGRMPSDAEIRAAAEALAGVLDRKPEAMIEAARAALEAAERERARGEDIETGDIAG